MFKGKAQRVNVKVFTVGDHVAEKYKNEGTGKHRAGVTTGAGTAASVVVQVLVLNKQRVTAMDIVNVCTAGLMLSSAALFAGNAVYDYKFGKKTTLVIRQFESGNRLLSSMMC